MNKTVLKKLKITDAENLFHLINQNKTQLIRYFPRTLAETTTVESTQIFLKTLVAQMENKEKYTLGIYHQSQLIGIVNIKNIDWRVPKCELGYFIDGAYQGKGIMSQVLKDAVAYCFDSLKVIKIYLRIGPENIGSQKIALKNGFVQEGLLRKEFRIETGELIDVLYYGIVNPAVTI